MRRRRHGRDPKSRSDDSRTHHQKPSPKDRRHLFCLYAAEDAKEAAAETKRLAWEAKNPERAKQKARDEFIREAMEYDMDEARQDARQNGDPWGDMKDEWIEEWKANNWSEEQEAEFEAEWKKSWDRDHGTAKAIEDTAQTQTTMPAPPPKHASATRRQPKKKPTPEPARGSIGALRKKKLRRLRRTP
jgi:hypothetical protein